MSAAPALRSWQTAFDAQHDVSVEQRTAFAAFLEQGLPTTKNDAWKYTDLRRLAMKEFRLAQGSTLAPVGILPLKNKVMFVDGVSAPNQLGDTATGASVDLSDSLGAFDKLNIAFSSSVCNLELLDQNEPLYLVHAWTPSSGGVMGHPRVSIKVPEGVNATLIEHYVGANIDANLTNSALDIEISADASLEHIRVQDDAPQNFNISRIGVRVASGSSYVNHHYALGGSLTRTDFNVKLTGERASAELHGLVFARDSQHLDVRSQIDHQVADTQSREDYRGIADQRGRVVFNGKVIVAKDAQRTDAAQSSRNLLLSPHAEIDTRPELEIYANDVKCAHGATVGQLDATALFYLQSRGIAHTEARALLTHAFAAEVIERIPVALVRDHVLARFMERMRAGASA